MGKLTEAIEERKLQLQQKRAETLKAVQSWASKTFGDDVLSVEYGTPTLSMLEFVVIRLNGKITLGVDPDELYVYDFSSIVIPISLGICITDQGSGQSVFNKLVERYGNV